MNWLDPLLRWESWTVIGGNLLPLLGIFYLGWDASTLIILYWTETAIVGFWLFVRLLFAPAGPASDIPSLNGGGLALGLFLLAHAGIFMGVHFFFLTTLAAGEWTRHLTSPADFVTGFIVPSGLWIPLGGLFAVRGILTLDEIRAKRPTSHLIAGFYARIVVMQFVILFGGMVSLFLGNPVILLVLIVGLKTCFEVYWDRVAAYLQANFSQPSRKQPD